MNAKSTPELRARRAERRAQHDPAARERLRESVSEWLDPPLTLASVLLLVITVIQLTTPIPAGRGVVLTTAATAIWIFFAASYLVELVLAPDRLDFVKKHWLA